MNRQGFFWILLGLFGFGVWIYGLEQEFQGQKYGSPKVFHQGEYLIKLHQWVSIWQLENDPVLGHRLNDDFYPYLDVHGFGRSTGIKWFSTFIYSFNEMKKISSSELIDQIYRAPPDKRGTCNRNYYQDDYFGQYCPAYDSQYYV